MYPGPDDPDLGVFVKRLADELSARGHEVERVVLDRRGGRRGRRVDRRRRAVSSGGGGRSVAPARGAVAAAGDFGPDVVSARSLVPTGLLAALASRAPLVVTAH